MAQAPPATTKSALTRPFSMSSPQGLRAGSRSTLKSAGREIYLNRSAPGGRRRRAPISSVANPTANNVASPPDGRPARPQPPASAGPGGGVVPGGVVSGGVASGGAGVGVVPGSPTTVEGAESSASAVPPKARRLMRAPFG